MEATANVIEPAPMSLPQRVLGIFLSPRKVLESLRDRPRLLGAIVVVAVAAAAGTYLVRNEIVNQQVDKIQANQRMTPEQQEIAIARTEKITPIVVPITIVLGAVVTPFVMGAVLLFLANVVLGGGATYKQLTAGYAHVQLIGILKLLIWVPLVRARHTVEIQTSLAALLSPDKSKTFLYHLLSRFDVFGLWSLALMVITVAVMGRMATRKAATGTIALWVVWSVIVVALGTVFGRFGG